MYEKELGFAKQVALKAGEVIAQNFFPSAPEKTWKSDNTPLTKTDTAINNMVLEQIVSTFPEHSFLGEEGSSSNLGQTEYVWVCDPIDGTIPYSHGWPCSVFSLALCKDGVPVVAVVNEPFFKRLYTAVKGEGCFLNDSQVHVTEETDWNRVYVGANIGPSSREKSNVLIYNLHAHGVRTVNLACVIYLGMLVASGQLAGVYFPYTNPWDAVTVKLLVEEAGGIVTDWEGKEQRYDRTTNGFIAGSTLLHEKLLSFTK
ncbi:MAG TPA: inositol monophosphatase [Patescibacteria group bacterium]|nr:inositol monophosphatase [Patescibacteria group bacterium]